ncbi:MAG: hypothetical protein HWE16_09480 [Gammaproteobacteria bacterium]|nr:hypothetical protein [Gammaproteobacteria bacterium]
MDAKELIMQIEKAFWNVPKPETSLAQFILTDEKGMAGDITDEEWFLAKIKRTDNHWTQLTDQELKDSDCVLAHMQANEFVYYLPAYMRYSVKFISAPIYESLIITYVIFHLDPMDELHSLDCYKFSQYKEITTPQCECIIAYLEFISRKGNDIHAEDAKKALSSFWSNNPSLTSPIIIP